MGCKSNAASNVATCVFESVHLADVSLTSAVCMAVFVAQHHFEDRMRAIMLARQVFLQQQLWLNYEHLLLLQL